MIVLVRLSWLGFGVEATIKSGGQLGATETESMYKTKKEIGMPCVCLIQNAPKLLMRIEGTVTSRCKSNF